MCVGVGTLSENEASYQTHQSGLSPFLRTSCEMARLKYFLSKFIIRSRIFSQRQYHIMTHFVIRRNCCAGNGKIVYATPRVENPKKIKYLLNRVTSPTTEQGSVGIYWGHIIVPIFAQ